MKSARSKKEIARIAGVYYLLMAITGGFGNLFLPSKILVPGDPAATLANLLANEFLFRLAIVSNGAGIILFAVLVLHLYRLFRDVHEHQANLMAVFVFVTVPIIFLLETLDFTALMLATGGLLPDIDASRGRNLAMLLLEAREYGIAAVSTFWGLWLLPLGALVYRSGFMPRVLGALLIAGGVSYVFFSVTFFLFPVLHQFARYGVTVFGLSEFAMILWLLIVGVSSRSESAAGLPGPPRAGQPTGVPEPQA